MRVAVIGTGYVGQVAGAALADFGHQVICLDKDASKIELLRQGQTLIYEPGLPELAQRNLQAGRLQFSVDVEAAVRQSEVVLIAVGTEGLPDGRVNMTAFYEVAQQIGRAMEHYTVIVIKSTVPVGSAAELMRLIRPHQKTQVPFDVVSNPEFQREGSAVKDFFQPYRIVLGVGSERALEIMKEIYRPLLAAGIPLVVTTNETAEIIKYAANAYLALKVSFINEIANLCDRLDCDVQAVSAALSLDPRIGTYLSPGPGFGGSCLPKDTLALIQQAQAAGVKVQMVEAAVEVNNAQAKHIVGKVKSRLGTLQNCTLGVLGLSFKGNTDDVRCSPAIRICELLLAEGARLRVYDPTAKINDRAVLASGQVVFCSSPYETAREARGLLVLTEWEEFGSLDLRRLRAMSRGDVLVDARNILDPKAAIEAGFTYDGVGRQAHQRDSVAARNKPTAGRSLQA
jgi:UDPglucose 6-dehydrogenase